MHEKTKECQSSDLYGWLRLFFQKAMVNWKCSQQQGKKILNGNYTNVGKSDLIERS